MRAIKRSDFLFLGFVAIAITMAAWSANSALASKKILIKFPHSVTVNTPKGAGAEYFRKAVEERLGDRVVVEVYPSASLMTDDASIEALAFGEVQMIAVPVSKLDRLTKKFQVFDLPFLFDDTEAVNRFQASQTGRDLLHVIDDKGFTGLGYWHNGMKHFGSPKPLHMPDDAAGLKFRIMESDVLQAQFQAVDANPQKMPFAEVYQALQTGAIDAQENTWSNLWSSRFYEVQPYIMESNHGFVTYFLATNSEFWNALPDDIRVELEAIADETSDFVNSEAFEINQRAKAQIIASGKSEIVQLSVSEKIAWREAMRPVWERFAPEIGDEIVNAAIAASQSEGS